MCKSLSAGAEIGTNRSDLAVLGSVATSAIDARERSPDSQRSSVEVDVHPAERERFTAAQPGVAA